MDKKEIIAILTEIGKLMELNGENKFKVQTYYNAANRIRYFEGDARELTITKIKGIGKTIIQNITELLETGKLAYYEELSASIPPGVLEMLKLRGVGVKKVKAIYDAGITTLDELETACLNDQLLELPGFGQKIQERILDGIEFLKKSAGQYRYQEMLELATPLIEKLKRNPNIESLNFVGGMRRKREIITDIDILISTDTPTEILDEISQDDLFGNVVERTNTRLVTRLDSGQEVDINLTSPENHPVALFFATGCKTYVRHCQERLKEAGLAVEWDQILQNGSPLLFADENAIFNMLELNYIPPELREKEWLDIICTQNLYIPKLIEKDDLIGLIHTHTLYSDGVSTIEQMAMAAVEQGYQYIGITDHSQSSTIANGMTEDRIHAQHEEIDLLNQKLDGIDILKGIECDILADGGLDYADEVLATFDFVMASVHAKFDMAEKEMTERIIKAISNPHVHMLGHPTGRLLLERKAYAVNLEEVIAAAAEYNVVIELNANPRRLDLDWRWLKYAIQKGVKICICPDAHRISAIEHGKLYGIPIARKGWLTAKEVINTYSKEDFMNAFKK